MPDSQGKRLQTFQGLDFDLELGDRSGRGGLIKDLFFRGLDLIVRCVFKILDVLGVKRRKAGHQDSARFRPALEHFQLAQPALEPFPSTAQRLEDRLGRGGEPPLQDRERETDGPRPFVVFESLGPVELLSSVLGNRLVKVRSASDDL